MDFFQHLIDFVLHTEENVNYLLVTYGSQIYWILFAIIFCETGLVVTPFLPGDSLIFLVGSLAALDGSPLNIFMLALILVVAAIGGNILNYEIGRFLGARVFNVDRWFFKRKYLTRAQNFYEKHGGKAIVLSRFMPILRTFAPFVAGIGKMNRSRFHLFNFFSGAGWVILFLVLGYTFGQIDYVQKNLKLVTVGIIIVSFLPFVYEYIRLKNKKNS